MASLKRTISRTLECRICLELLSDPKQLSCAHTFCKGCLDNIFACSCQSETVNSVTCPICRSITKIQDGNVMNLNTDIHKYVVEELRNSQQFCHCEVCQAGSKAVHFCQECKKNMCNECLENHNKLPANLKHRVVFVKDIKERKVVLRSYCQEHEESDGQQNICSHVCLTCMKFICRRCGMLLHEKEGHTVVAADKYKVSFQKKIQPLQALGEGKVATIETNMAVIEGQMKRVIDHIDGLYVKITSVHKVLVKELEHNKSALKEQIDAEKGTQCQLQKIKGDHERMVASLKSASVLLDKSLKAPLSGDVIAIHDSLSGTLQSLINLEDPDDQLV